MLHLPNLDLHYAILEACPTCAQLDVLLGTWGEGEGCLIEWADQDVPNLWGWEGTNLLKCWGKRLHQDCVCFAYSHGGNEIVNWCLCTILELSKTKWGRDAQYPNWGSDILLDHPKALHPPNTTHDKIHNTANSVMGLHEDESLIIVLGCLVVKWHVISEHYPNKNLCLR
jgi:hypothetical protein